MRTQQEIEQALAELESRANYDGSPADEIVRTTLRWALGDVSTPERAPFVAHTDSNLYYGVCA